MVTRPNSNQARLKRHARVRSKVSGTAACPRLDVFRSNSNIYAQLIDDVNGVTLAAASSNEKELLNAPFLRASPRLFLTAADTFITAVSRSLPKVPARADSSSDKEEYFWLQILTHQH